MSTNTFLRDKPTPSYAAAEPTTWADQVDSAQQDRAIKGKTVLTESNTSYMQNHEIQSPAIECVTQSHYGVEAAIKSFQELAIPDSIKNMFNFTRGEKGELVIQKK